MIFEIVIPLILGVVLFLGGIVQRKKMHRLLNHGKRVKGIVFTIKQTKNGTIPIIRFTTHKNEWVTRELRNGFNLGFFVKGDEIEIIYNPNNPEEVEIYQPSILTFFSHILIISSIGLIIYGYINFLEYI